MTRHVFLAPLVALALSFTAAGAAAAPAEDHWTTKNDGPLAAVRAQIQSGEYQAAISVLQTMAAVDPGHAELHNLIGFALRKADRLEEAAVAYRRALILDPHHLGALEYQGELFVRIGDMSRAEANLRRLERLCPQRCEERDDLAEAIRGAQ